MLGGILAGAIFKRIWKAAAGEDEAGAAALPGPGRGRDTQPLEVTR